MCAVCDSARTVTEAANALTLACNAQISLRKHWARILKEKVPDDLTRLLDRLD